MYEGDILQPLYLDSQNLCKSESVHRESDLVELKQRIDNKIPDCGRDPKNNNYEKNINKICLEGVREGLIKDIEPGLFDKVQSNIYHPHNEKKLLTAVLEENPNLALFKKQIKQRTERFDKTHDLTQEQKFYQNKFRFVA